MRRRVAWVGALVAVAAAAAAAVLMLPKGTPEPQVLRPGADVVTTPRAVKLTAERQTRDRCAARFVRSRRDGAKEAAAGLPLVTQSFRAGVSREQWSRGDLPVFPYTARGEQFHKWRLNYSYPREVSVELLFHPAPKETLGPIAVTAVFKQIGRRWLIDSFVTSASFAPESKPAKVVAHPDFSPLAEGRGKGAAVDTVAPRSRSHPRADGARSDRVRYRAPAPLPPRLARVPLKLDSTLPRD